MLGQQNVNTAIFSQPAAASLLCTIGSTTRAILGDNRELPEARGGVLRHQAGVEGSSHNPTTPATLDAIMAPSIGTPPRSATPPPAGTDKRKPERKSNEENFAHGERAASANPVDANALNKALLKEFEGGRQREVTPGGSPVRKRPRIHGDR